MRVLKSMKAMCAFVFWCVSVRVQAVSRGQKLKAYIHADLRENGQKSKEKIKKTYDFSIRLYQVMDTIKNFTSYMKIFYANASPRSPAPLQQFGV